MKHFKMACPQNIQSIFRLCLCMFQVYIEKQKGEILGVVIVESGWGSILPTVIIASLMHAGPAAKSGRLNIGDQIMTVNGTSLVGLPLSTCQSIIKVCFITSAMFHISEIYYSMAHNNWLNILPLSSGSKSSIQN